MENTPLIIEQLFNAPVALVWRALTEKELMKKWYFDIPDFRLEVGAKFHFEGGREDRCYIHECEILEIEPLEKLKYSWKYEGYAGLSFVTFELYPIGQQTRLKLIHERLESFPPENPDFAQENFRGGWNFLLKESLKEFLEKGKSLIGQYDG
ncbi:MAG: SRPBCC domain-containing protein [Eudoraea sp.]|nr:SRPBCC domain-containing protein [Eudoraea sp.]